MERRWANRGSSAVCRVSQRLAQTASLISPALCKPAMRNGILGRSCHCLSFRNQPRSIKTRSQPQYGYIHLGIPWRWNGIIRRGIKSEATISLRELSNDYDGANHGLPSEHATEKVYPTVVQQALNNMEKYENCVLLTRVGSFYEVKARHISEVLVLTQRNSFISIKQTSMARCSISKLQRKRQPKDQYQWRVFHSTSLTASLRS